MSHHHAHIYHIIIHLPPICLYIYLLLRILPDHDVETVCVWCVRACVRACVCACACACVCVCVCTYTYDVPQKQSESSWAHASSSVCVYTHTCTVPLVNHPYSVTQKHRDIVRHRTPESKKKTPEREKKNRPCSVTQEPRDSAAQDTRKLLYTCSVLCGCVYTYPYIAHVYIHVGIYAVYSHTQMCVHAHP